MKLTVPGQDMRLITEEDLDSAITYDKVHLLKFKFGTPSITKIEKAMDLFPRTNRFVVSDNIRLYNEVLKKTEKKYYVMNREEQNGLISFFRKNNKVLLCIPNLTLYEKNFVLDVAFKDVLDNLEVIMLEKKDFEIKIGMLELWPGNVIVYETQYRNYL